MKRLSLTALVLVGALGLIGTAPIGSDGTSYRFREAPVNSMGVKSMADLRGKPVLIDFWGTR